MILDRIILICFFKFEVYLRYRLKMSSDGLTNGQTRKKWTDRETDRPTDRQMEGLNDKQTQD